jgi:hypothetical protein
MMELVEIFSLPINDRKFKAARKGLESDFQGAIEKLRIYRLHLINMCLRACNTGETARIKADKLAFEKRLPAEKRQLQAALRNIEPHHDEQLCVYVFLQGALANLLHIEQKYRSGEAFTLRQIPFCNHCRTKLGIEDRDILTETGLEKIMRVLTDANW